MNLKTEIIEKTSNPFLIADPDLQKKIDSLKNKIARLNSLCLELNPYQEISTYFQEELKFFGILEFSDPFFITNRLVTLLEDAINELHQISPLTDHDQL